MALIKCSKCGKEFDVELLECIHCKKALFTNDSYLLLTLEEKRALKKLLMTTNETYKNNMLLGLGSACVAILLILVGLACFSILIMALGFISLFFELYFLNKAMKYEKNYYDENIAKLSKKSKKEIVKINEEEQTQKAQMKKKLTTVYIILGIIFVLAIIIVNIILNQQTDADYDRMKRCWDKGMDYNYETGRCKTADEAYRDWLTDPYS